MATIGDIDILDEPDALREDAEPICHVCGEPTRHSRCEYCQQWYCPNCVAGPFAFCCDEERAAAYEDDPSPMCNCGTCSHGDYTCIRKD